MKYDIIMFNMSGYFDYESGLINNRNRNIWRELEKRDDVHRILAVDFLPFTWKTTLKQWLKAKIYRGGNFFHRLRQINSISSVYSTVTPFLQPSRFVPELLEVCSVLGFGRYRKLISWSYNPLNLSGWIDLPADIRIFDTVDNWSQHTNFCRYQEVLRTNYRQIEDNAHCIFTVAADLVSLFSRNKHVYWIPNGVDTSHFQPSAHHNPPSVLKGIPRPMVGYVGIIQDRLDVDLLEKVVQKSPHISWVFVGPTWPVFLKSFRPKPLQLKRLGRFSNVHFVGAQLYRDIPRFIQSFDVVMIPHKKNDFTRSMNPLKLYEYLSMGKPVVSTHVAGLEDFLDEVSIASSSDQFLYHIEHALAADNDSLRKKRQIRVQDIDWRMRLAAMMEHIHSLERREI